MKRRLKHILEQSSGLDSSEFAGTQNINIPSGKPLLKETRFYEPNKEVMDSLQKTASTVFSSHVQKILPEMEERVIKKSVDKISQLENKIEAIQKQYENLSKEIVGKASESFFTPTLNLSEGTTPFRIENFLFDYAIKNGLLTNKKIKTILYSSVMDKISLVIVHNFSSTGVALKKIDKSLSWVEDRFPSFYIEIELIPESKFHKTDYKDYKIIA